MASLSSMVALAWLGWLRHGHSAALINAPSHWVFGRRALHTDGWRPRFTLGGALIHHVSALFWAGFYEALMSLLAGYADAAFSASSSARARPLPATGRLLGGAAALAALAWIVDTRLVPSRLAPGFEQRVSSKGLLLIYSAFGVGLACGERWSARPRATMPDKGGSP